MAGWYVDKGLDVLIKQEKELHPGIVVGTIGDATHQERNSPHNPEADGSVDAADFMVGSHFSKADAQELFDQLYTYRDKRIRNFIYNHQIVSSVTQPWVIRSYTGSDPHTGHLHLEVNDLHENDRSEWQLSQNMRKLDLELDGFSLPTIRYGEDDQEYGSWDLVVRVQKMLGITHDGRYGPATAKAIREYMGGGDGKVIDGQVWIRLYGLTHH